LPSVKQKINNKNSLMAGYQKRALAHHCWPSLTHKHNKLTFIIGQKKIKGKKKNTIAAGQDASEVGAGESNVYHGMEVRK